MRALFAIVLAAATGGMIFGVDGISAIAKQLKSVPIESGSIVQPSGGGTAVVTRQNGVKATLTCTCDQGTGTCTLTTTTDSAYCSSSGGTCKSTCSMSVTTTGLSGRAGAVGRATGTAVPLKGP
jgi:hypothetical protein